MTDIMFDPFHFCLRDLSAGFTTYASRCLAAIKDTQRNVLLAALLGIGFFPMFVAAHHRLLGDDQFDEGFALRIFFQLLERRFLRLGHGAANAMPFAFELADIYAGAWDFRHGGPRLDVGRLVRSGLDW